MSWLALALLLLGAFGLGVLALAGWLLWLLKPWRWHL
jgi:hypothetical protein